jgi:glycosyltransferase involved in cell wall biosynthesis
LHIATSHWPYDTRIYRKELLALTRNGYSVSFATTVDAPKLDGRIQLLPIGAHGGTRWRRLERNFRALLTISKSPAPVVHIHEPELLITIIPALLAGKRIIYDIHEFYRQRISESHWIWPFARSALAKFYVLLENVLLPHFAGIVVVTEQMEEQYRRRFPEGIIALVRNFPWIDQQARIQAKSGPPPIPGKYIIHVGGATRLKAFDVIVAVAERLRKRGFSEPILNFGPVDLSGFPPQERKALLQRAKIADVRLMGILEHPELLPWIAHARIGYVLYADVDIFRLALSTKLFEYFAVGIPVVAPAIGQIGEVVDQYGAGLTGPAADVQAQADVLERLLQDDQLADSAGNAAREASRHFSFESEQHALLALYARIFGPQAPRGRDAVRNSADALAPA